MVLGQGKEILATSRKKWMQKMVPVGFLGPGILDPKTRPWNLVTMNLARLAQRLMI